MEHVLEKRVLYFLRSSCRGREDVRRTLNELRPYGRLALVGGMLRDVALFGNVGFKSDVDLVIYPRDVDAFEKRMQAIGARQNRFGGYALPLRKWQVDVWPLKRTWVCSHANVTLGTVMDLCDATFFNCDAIVYDLDVGRLRAKPRYFDDLAARVLEINFPDNPNPRGNAVRAMRYALIKGFHWGPHLSRFVAGIIDTVGWNALQEGEFRSFRTRYLDLLDPVPLKEALDQHVSTDAPLFDPSVFRKNVQLPLPYMR